MRRVVTAATMAKSTLLRCTGARMNGPVVETLFDGPAYVAARAGVPIVPVGIGGSEKAMPKGSKIIHPVKITIVIGRPLVPEAREEGARVPRRAVAELTAALKVEVQRLFDEAQKQVAG